MASFIVISTKESLNWIVDGILECRPHNSDVATYISAGKIYATTDGRCRYEYSHHSKHSDAAHHEDSFSSDNDLDEPRIHFRNQIAHFRYFTHNHNEPVNIFLLDNPLNEDEFKHSQWLLNELESVYEKHYDTNFRVTHIFFSYLIDKPEDVVNQIPADIISQLLDNHNKTKGTVSVNIDYTENTVPTRIFYIDNQDRQGRAICTSKKEHDIFLPRMLCDLMMLLSNADDSHHIINTADCQTGIYAVGYSECMYYHDDAFRYYDIAGRRDLTDYLLNEDNGDDSLDFDRHPIGLSKRMERLAEKYDEVPFTLDISTKPESIDKAIDDILISLHNDIQNVLSKVFQEAAEKDAEATKEARELRLQEIRDSERISESDISDEPQNEPAESERKGCNFIARLFHKNEEVPVTVEYIDPRVADIKITDETEKKKIEYKILDDFIDRYTIYTDYLKDPSTLENGENTYMNLLKFIASPPFTNYIDDAKKLLRIRKIEKLKEEREKFFRLKAKVEELTEELEELTEELEEFKLSTHCTSVDNLIDLNRLKEYHDGNKDERLYAIIRKWNMQNEQDKCISSIYNELMEKTKWDLFPMYYVDWKEPLDFIKKDIQINDICDYLHAKSKPFVNTYVLPMTAENSTFCYLCTDNMQWFNDITSQRVHIKDSYFINNLFSLHICSKICMFQFLQMTDDMIKGLADCHTDRQMPV